MLELLEADDKWLALVSDELGATTPVPVQTIFFPGVREPRQKR